MKKSDALKQERSQLVTAQNELVNTVEARGEDAVFSKEEKKEFDKRQAEIEALDAKIEEATQVEEVKKRAAESAGASEAKSLIAPEDKEMGQMRKRYSLHKALRSQMVNNNIPLDGVEREIHDEAVKDARAAGVEVSGLVIPTSSKRADGQTVTQDSGNFGGALVGETTMGVIDLLRPKPITEELGATFMRDLRGNVKFPVNQGGITATWEGEVTQVSNSKNQYGSKTMSPNRLAVSVPISLQNILQSSIDLEAYTIADIRDVIANEIDAKAINGSGTSNQPLGLLNDPDINVQAAGTNGGAPTWAQIVALESDVYIANANAAKMGYLINPATKGKLKVTKHEAGDLGYLMAMDNTINGYKVAVSNLVPSNLTKGTGTNLSAAIFGDWKQLLIGQWGFMDISVDEFSRKREGYVEITVNAFVDVLVKQPKAFSAIKDLSLA